MMSNKRGCEDISGEVQHSPQSEHSTPKRSKLDFLAMIAELSEQKAEEAKLVTSSAPTTQNMAENHHEQAQSPKSDSPQPMPVVKKPTTAPPPKAEAPKSSFAAWKLAKGRKNSGSKSPKRRDASVSPREVSVSDTSSDGDLFTDTAAPVPKVVPEAVPLSTIKVSPMMENPLVALAAVAAPLPVARSPTPEVEVIEHQMPSVSTGSLPPKKAIKEKDSSSKTSMSPKKAASSSKKGLGKKSKGSGKGKSKKGDQSGVKAATFPEKIMELLQGGLATSAIYWLPEGEAIAVDPDSFKDSPIISKQFRGNKLSSFVRSLNRWGFRRIFYHSLPDKTLAFYHRLFQKQAPELVKEMKMDGGEKEPELPQGAMATAPTAAAEGKQPALAIVENPPPEKKPESPVSSLPTVAASANPPLPALSETVPVSPGLSAAAAAAPAAAVQALQAALQAGNLAAPAPAPPVALPAEPVVSATAIPAPAPSHNPLEQSALELAENQYALQLQQAMAAEQERSDLASLQAQQLVLQSLADQQNVAQAEELLMQSMLAEQHRSELALQQRQAEQALLQQMLAEQENAALTAALGGGAGAGGGLNAEALLRERLLVQQLAGNPPAPAAAAPGSADVLALLQQQLQGGQQPQAREPSYMEQLLLLEQQQQQQRQQEAALLAAHGFRFG